MKDVLENMPTAAPSTWSLVVSLASPLTLAAKALYDLCKGISDLTGPERGATGSVAMLTVNLVCSLVACAAAAALIQAYYEARTKKKDVHHARAIERVQRLIDEQNGGPSNRP